MQVISYTSLFRYQFNALVQLQYSSRSDGCGIITDPGYLATAKVRYPPEAAAREACDSILRDSDLQLSLPVCLAGIAGLLALFHVLSFMALLRLRIQKKA